MKSFARGIVALLACGVMLSAPVLAQAAPPKTTKARSGDPVVQGRPLSTWIQDLGADAPYTRVAAAYAVGSAGTAGKSAVPALVANLSSESPPVRYASALALGEIGPPAAEAVPALQKLLDDHNDDVAHIARKSLKAITGEAVE